MAQRAVVSFANTPFYQDKMKRLQDSVESQDIKFIGFKSIEEIGCKPHSEIPYQFKPYAIHKAIEMEVTTLLWCDSPIYAIGNLMPVFEYIEREGYMFFNNYGHPLGRWTNDRTLFAFDKTREQAMNMKQIMACCMGFTTNAIPKVIDAYQGLSEFCYPGSWDNHRHDQTVMSFLIHKHGLKILDGHKTFFIYEHFRQVPEFQPISDSVCLISK